MIAGIGVLALPIAGLAVLGYGYSKYKQSQKKVNRLKSAIKKLHKIRNKLEKHQKYCYEEISGVDAVIQILQRKIN